MKIETIITEIQNFQEEGVDSSFTTLLISEHSLSIIKPLETIFKGLYTERKEITLDKEKYTLRELIDLGLVLEDRILNYEFFGDEIDYDYSIEFKPGYVFYTANHEAGVYDFSGIVGLSTSNETVIELVIYTSKSFCKTKGLSKYYTKLTFKDRTEAVLNNKQALSEEVLSLIPQDFGEYTFSGKSPYQGSLSFYFENKKGDKCRISDHHFGEYSKTPYGLVYNIVLE